VLALARSDDGMRTVPIIVCSADIGQIRQRAMEFERIGNIHVRLKPFDSDEMVMLIDRLVSSRTTERSHVDDPSAAVRPVAGA
jgi:hypothetical protein